MTPFDYVDIFCEFVRRERQDIVERFSPERLNRGVAPVSENGAEGWSVQGNSGVVRKHFALLYWWLPVSSVHDEVENQLF
jgi:hypothetical protein